MPIVHIARSDDPRAIKNAVRDLKRSGYNDGPTAVMDDGTEAPLATLADFYPEGMPADLSPPVDPPPLTSPTLDDLFVALKAARDDLELAEMACADAEFARLAAEKRKDEASAERLVRAKAFRAARDAFDAAIVPRVDPSPITPTNGKKDSG